MLFRQGIPGRKLLVAVHANAFKPCIQYRANFVAPLNAELALPAAVAFLQLRVAIVIPRVLFTAKTAGPQVDGLRQRLNKGFSVRGADTLGTGFSRLFHDGQNSSDRNMKGLDAPPFKVKLKKPLLNMKSQRFDFSFYFFFAKETTQTMSTDNVLNPGKESDVVLEDSQARQKFFRQNVPGKAGMD